MAQRGRGEASRQTREDEGSREALEHVLGAGLESEIAAARSALEEARGLLGTWGAWQAFSASKAWTLTSGAGTKTVWVQYRDKAGNLSAAAKDTITYSP